MHTIFLKNKLFALTILVISLLLLFPKNNFAKISDKYAVKTFWQEAPIMPGAAKYFIRTEKIEKRTKILNSHPIKISPEILRRILKQLTYKYDRDERDIPLFSNKELTLLSEHVPKALRAAKPNEDITFVVKGPHSSARWSFKEERLTAGRIFVVNNQLNLIIGAVQVNLQPTLDERYQGNVWETAKLTYDIGHRNKIHKYEGLILVYNEKAKGIHRKSAQRKDWFIFTNTAYQEAKQSIEGGGGTKKQQSLSKEQYKSLQQQIDSLQKELNKKNSSPPRQRVQRKETATTKQKPENNNSSYSLEQRLKTIESLHKKGILSEEEYNKKRQEILRGL